MHYYITSMSKVTMQGVTIEKDRGVLGLNRKRGGKKNNPI